jgi:hypothetical protein
MSPTDIHLRPPAAAERPLPPKPVDPPRDRRPENPAPSPHGTPVDAPATRPDLTGTPPVDPGWAVAAPARTSAPRPEIPVAAPPPFVDTLKALRGQAAPVGTLLDRAA